MIEGDIYFLSRIKADKIFTIHKTITKKRFGRVNKTILARVQEEIKNLFF